MKINFDKIILVDANDNSLGEMDKYQAHEHPAKLHRASSVWLVNSKGQVLLQKRSDKKIVGAGWWGNAVCGNLRPGESYEDCARRRLKEEIGVGRGVGIGTRLSTERDSEYLEIKPIFKFTYKAYCNEKYGEHEMDQVFFAKYDGKVVLNKDEVSEVAWVDFDDLVGQVGRLGKPIAQKTLNMSLEDLKKHTASCEIRLNGEKHLLAPWTWMMLRDKRFLDFFK
jgi:isopentenyl-diphosphate Delta-isomerase